MRSRSVTRIQTDWKSHLGFYIHFADLEVQSWFLRTCPSYKAHSGSEKEAEKEKNEEKETKAMGNDRVQGIPNTLLVRLLRTHKKDCSRCFICGINYERAW